MKRLAIVLLTLMAVPAIADPDPDDTNEPSKKPKKKKKKKKKKPDDTKKKPDEIEMTDDPTAAPPPVDNSRHTGTTDETVVTPPVDPNAAATAPVGPIVVANATPLEMTKRPLVIQAGRLDVGGYIAMPRGPDYTSSTANSPIGKWIGFDLRAEYGAIDKLSVGLTIELAPITSDSTSSDTASSKVGGFVADAKYALIDGQRTSDKEPLQLAGHLSIGLLKRGQPAFGPFSIPLYGFDLEPSLGLGVAIQKTFMDQKLAAILDPHLFFQASGNQSNDATGMQVLDALITFELPICVMYQAAPNISVGGRTGIYTGQKFSFSPSENLAIPFVAEGVFTTLKNQLDIGADLGLGNLTPRGSNGPLETFLFGIFATYRTK